MRKLSSYFTKILLNNLTLTTFRDQFLNDHMTDSSYEKQVEKHRKYLN